MKSARRPLLPLVAQLATRWAVPCTLALAAVIPAAAAPVTNLGDDFAREGKNRGVKDALEGKVAPALQVSAWLNTGGEALDLAALRGKVVVLDFWGTW